MLTWNRLEYWARDLKLAVRSLRQRPGFFCLATLALAVGTGGVCAMFSLVHSILLRPLPYPDAGRIVVIHDQLVNDPASRNLVSPAQVRAWTEGASAFEKIGAFTEAFFTLTGGGREAERIPALLASTTALEILGASPLEGRLYGNSEPSDATGQVLVSESLWKRRFGGARLNGQTLLIDDQVNQIVGVLPAHFRFLDRRYDAIRRLPSRADRQPEENRRFRYLSVLGRLRTEASYAEAAGQLEAVARRLGELFPATDALRTVGLTSLDEVLRGSSRARLWLSMVAVSALLMIACLNVGSMMLGRNLAREREISVRLALGAKRSDLFRQVVCEAIVLAFAGASVGLLVARFSLEFLVSLTPEDALKTASPDIGAPILAFTAAISIVSAIVIALLTSRQTSLRRGFQIGGRGSSIRDPKLLGRGILLGSEVALAMLLVVSAGTAFRSLIRLLNNDFGFQPTGAKTIELSMSARNRPSGDGPQFLRRLEAEIASIPGMRSAGLTHRLPLGDDRSTRPINVGSAPDSARQEMIEVRRVSPGFFDAIGMRLIHGRLLLSSDTSDTARVALVNQRFAQRFFGLRDPVGQQLFIQEGLDPSPARIIGVVNDVRQISLIADPQPEVYLSVFVHPSPNIALIVRGASDTGALIPEVRRRLAQLDPAMPLAATMPLTNLIEGSAAPQRFLAFLLAVFSSFALILAAVGIYGVCVFAVTRRRVEIGIRMALGARSLDVVTLVLGWIGRVVGIGVAVGGLLSFAANRWAGAYVAGLEQPGFTMVGVAAFVFWVTALLAAAGPALGASLISPAIAQRSTD